MPLSYDPYEAPKALGIFQKIPSHAFQDVNAGTIQQRIEENKKAFEERQAEKARKAKVEEDAKTKETERAKKETGGANAKAAATHHQILDEEQKLKEDDNALSG